MTNRTSQEQENAVQNVEVALQNAAFTASQYIANPTKDNESTLNERLTKVVREVCDIDPTGRLRTASPNVIDFLTQCRLLLDNPSSTAIIRSKTMLALFNIALYNIPIRRYLAGDLMICEPVFTCLQKSLIEQTGPQNLIDILRLLQVLTYDRSIVVGPWTSKLIKFLMDELCKDDEPEWMPYCLAILCNLVSRSKRVVQTVQKSGMYKPFGIRLVKRLSHNSRIVVACSLVLTGYLDEKLRSAVYDVKNVSQTFLCLFNVLTAGDALMTTHIAADLLRRLVVTEPSPSSPVPTISSTAKDLTTYKYFESAIQNVAELIVTMDYRWEESFKIVELIVSFCRVPDLRSAVCQALLKQTPKENRRTPIMALCQIAQLTDDQAIRPEIPFNAIRLLNYVVKEAVNSGMRVSDVLDPRELLSLIKSNIKTTVETNSEFVIYQCHRITEGLRLAETLSHEEDLRADLLDVVSVALCGHIYEFQLISNRIVNFMARPYPVEDLPEWSAAGVAIPLELVKLISGLKDHSRPHKELYWRYLKEGHLVPFIAFAIARGDAEMVEDALGLLRHCAQIQDFSMALLSSQIVHCTKAKTVGSTHNGTVPAQSLQNGHSRNSLPSIDHWPSMEASTANGDSNRRLDELLVKFKDSLHGNQPQTSDIVYAFEQKVATLKNRERELEHTIALKDQMLQQMERNIAASRGRDTSLEVSELCRHIDTLEKSIKQKELVIKTLEQEKGELSRKCKQFSDAADQSKAQYSEASTAWSREKEDLLEENKKDRELYFTTKEQLNEMSNKFNIASKTSIEKQNEVEMLTEKLNESHLREQQANSSLTEALKRVEALTVKNEELSSLNEKLKTKNAKLLKALEDD